MRIALFLSGGKGTRLQAELPKQYILIGKKRLFSYGLETLFSLSEIGKVAIVAEPAWREVILEAIGSFPEESRGKFLGFSLPGENRQCSILNGLRDIRGMLSEARASQEQDEEDIVLIQDAARPLTSPSLIQHCLHAVEEGHEGALPVLPMKDTVYLSRDGHCITDLLPREQVFAGQAPEAFRLQSYLSAVEALLPVRILSIHGSTEPAVLAGMDVALLPGEESNFKVTTPADLERFRQEMGLI